MILIANANENLRYNDEEEESIEEVKIDHN